MLLLNVDRVGKRVEGRESSDDRDVKLSAWRIGERPEISLCEGQFTMARLAFVYSRSDKTYKGSSVGFKGLARDGKGFVVVEALTMGRGCGR